MHLQERGGWVDEPWETADPDDVEDTVKDLMVAWSGTPVDAFWHHIMSIDPLELTNLRGHQMMALARYARQPLHGWDDVDVTELRFWYRQLKELMQMEAEASNITEDRL